jgi:hypothetical protein
LSRETGEVLDVLALGKTFGLPVPVAHDHRNPLSRIMRYVKHNYSKNIGLLNGRSPCHPTAKLQQIGHKAGTSPFWRHYRYRTSLRAPS